ncbi:MAG: Ig-like domain-containing protein [Archangium sp.]
MVSSRSLLFGALVVLVSASCVPDTTGTACNTSDDCPTGQHCGPTNRCVAGPPTGGGTGGGSDGGGGGTTGGGGGGTTGGGGGTTGGGGGTTGGGGGTTGGGGGTTGGGGGDDGGTGGGGGTTGGGGGTTGGGGGTTGGGGGTTGGGGGGMADTTPPEVQRATPTDLSMNVSVDTPIEIVFSEPMDTQSVIFLTSPTITFASQTWIAGNTVLTLTPNAPLQFARNYGFTITGRDVAGNSMMMYPFSFTTQSMPDMTPPSLIDSQPATGAMNVATTTGLVLTFNEPMNTNSVQVSLSPSATLGTPSWANNNTELSIAPAAALTAMTMYQVNVSGTDVAGNALGSSGRVTFTTAAPPDTTPPTLVMSTPTPDAGGVVNTTNLSLTFSESMNTSSLALVVNPPLDQGTPTWTNSDRTATFSMRALPWTDSTDYSIDISASDLAGNTTFNTLQFRIADPPDTVRPTVTATAPGSGDTGVPQNTTIEFNFSEPMNMMATEGALNIAPAATCTFTWNAQRTLMSCRPTLPLTFSTSYTVTLGTGAHDDANNTLMAPYVFSFTTAAMPDLTPPTITATAPAQNAIGVDRYTAGFPKFTPTPIAITFSESMSQAAAQGAFSITSPTGYNGGTFSWNRNTMIYTPPSAFAYNAQIQFRVLGGTGNGTATDLAGNKLAATYNGTFRMRRQSTTKFYSSGTVNSGSTSALDGYMWADIGCTNATVSSGSSIAVSGATSGSQAYRGYVTFDIGYLGTLANVNISAATLNMNQTGCNGNPFSSTFGGAIEAWHVNYGPTLTTLDCSLTNINSLQYTLSNSLTLGWKTVSVLAKVEDDFANLAARGNRSQFQLRTATLATSGTTSNYCSFGTFNQATANDPYLNITYDYD